MKIYLAGPLFSTAEKIFNEDLCKILENIGFNVFLPQRDGAEKTISNYEELQKEEKRQAIFRIDYEQIVSSDIFLFILDGRIPDEGACVELGIAYTIKKIKDNNKIIIGLHTDSRAAFIGSKLNPMIKIPIDIIFDSTEELIRYLSQIVYK
jgi:nucleoside 2-deoxyribosyltransferase